MSILLVYRDLIQKGVGDRRTACTLCLSHAYSLRIISHREKHLRYVDDDRKRLDSSTLGVGWTLHPKCNDGRQARSRNRPLPRVAAPGRI
jgi:hypothetical protein